MGIARALCMLLRRELPLLALRERSRLTRPAERRLGERTPYTHLYNVTDLDESIHLTACAGRKYARQRGTTSLWGRTRCRC